MANKAVPKASSEEIASVRRRRPDWSHRQVEIYFETMAKYAPLVASDKESARYDNPEDLARLYEPLH